MTIQTLRSNRQAVAFRLPCISLCLCDGLAVGVCPLQNPEVVARNKTAQDPEMSFP